jgi:Beta-lactamase enzyme family
VAGDVLVDPLDGGHALRGRGDDRRAGPPGPPAPGRDLRRTPSGRDLRHPGRDGGRRAPGRESGSGSEGDLLTRFAASVLLLLLASVAVAQPTPSVPSDKPSTPKPLDPTPALDAALARIAGELVTEFKEKGLTDEGLSIVVIDMSRDTPGGSFPTGGYRGDVSYYPCSVVKLCFLSYYETRKQAGKLKDTPELVRAVHDMITVSSNDATGFVVDSLTDTTSGPELTGVEWERWKARRNVVNDWYRGKGFTNLNANQKTFCEDAYGRETAFRDNGKNRNRMTAAEAARIFKEIVRGEIAGEVYTAEMMGLLHRDVTPDEPFEDMELEDARLAAKGLPRGSRVWAKSGDAYDFHHLVGRIALPNGSDFVIAVFTKGVKDVPEVIPRAYEKVTALFLAPRP